MMVKLHKNIHKNNLMFGNTYSEIGGIIITETRKQAKQKGRQKHDVERIYRKREKNIYRQKS